MKPLLASVTVLFLASTLSAWCVDTALETSMKKMADAAHQLAADLKVTDPTKHNKDVDLNSVAIIKAETLKAHDLEPKKAQALPADQGAAMNAAYQKDMDTFSPHVDQLAKDIQDEKWDVAKADFATLMQDEKEGHKKYRVKK